jgi:histone-lysine N-methyltransferase SETMAR
VQKDFVPEEKTINAVFYKGIMDCTLKCIQQDGPATFCSQDFFLLHDNAPAHKAASFLPIFDPTKVTTLYHPPYSPDLSLSDYFLFPKLKIKLKGLHFADVAEIQEAEFSAAFQKLYNHTKVCVYANRAYFEFKKKKKYMSSLCVFKK